MIMDERNSGMSSDSCREFKKALRKEIAALKKLIPAEEKLRLSESVMDRVESLPEFREADTVLLYHAMEDEVQTAFFIDRWYGRKRIVLPLVSGDDLLLKEYDPSKLRPGYRGIPEPDPECTDVDPSEIGFAVIPGVAFDRDFNRMGRGKGFYDRLLPRLSCPKYGVAFPCQIVGSVPVEPFDKKLDGVVF